MKVAFDVDGTLIDARDRPRENIVTLLKAFRPIANITVWSGSGKDYAEMWVRRLFLEDYVDEVCAKPIAQGRPPFQHRADVTFDDQECHLGKVNILVPLEGS